MHTPPFYSTARGLKAGIHSIAYDYGEPSPAFFPDAELRKTMIVEKNSSISLAHQIYAISNTVKAESPHARCQLLPLANDHLAVWNEAFVHRRMAVREHHALAGKTVVLNVCRYHQAERHYKGVDTYLRVRDTLQQLNPQAADNIVFAIAGRAMPDDIKAMQDHGLRVFANMNNEGYNLGIGQALAMGLPVVASDIPAHRTFDIFTTNDPALAAKQLLALAEKASTAPDEQASAHLPRRPIVTPWRTHTDQLGQILLQKQGNSGQ